MIRWVRRVEKIMRRHTAIPLFLTALALPVSVACAQRAIGIDVSAWQGPSIDWTNVAKPIAQGGGGIQFAFIRSSRGGTTGTYNQSTQVGTLSHRYDDPYFVSNITQAKSKGILAGAYHFARADLSTNTGLDEANHFIEQAGNYMKPGYLRPVMDLEAGDTRTTTDLTNWAMAFSDRIFAVKGIRPLVYVNINYANQVDSRINIHDLWLARYISSSATPGPYDAAVQDAIDPPAASGLNTYGAWAPGGTFPTPRPWDFWQYGSTGTCPGVSGNCDRNIANGDIEFVKEFLTPAVWNVDAAGDWSNAANWNSQTYLPVATDRVFINRSAGVYNITLSTGTHSIRSLQLNEPLTVNGGSLNIVQYANLNSVVTMNNGSLVSGSLVSTTTLTLNGGNISTGDVTGNGILLANGGDFSANSLRLGTVNLNGGNVHLTSAATSVVTNLVDGGNGGNFDIATAKLVVNYSGASPINLVRALIQSAYASGTWTGSGIKSSGLPANLAIGYAEASSILAPAGGTWGGISVDGTSVLIARALKGDSNLSGTVDFDDLLALAQSYEGTGTWINGDFNYDAAVNFDDLLILAQNYETSMSQDGTLLAGDSSGFESDWARARTLVPEPTMLTALLPIVTMLRRRR